MAQQQVAKSTIDLEKAKADYAQNGYCILPGILSASEVAEVRQRVTEQAIAERALGWARLDAGVGHQERSTQDQQALLREDISEIKGGVNQRVGFLINKGRVFRDLVTNPVILELVEHALGHDFLLSACDVNIAVRGGALEGLHRDAWWCPIGYREGDSYIKVGDRKRNPAEPDSAPSGTNTPPACCNTIWMLTDFTEENGGTRIVPGSHRLPGTPDGSVPHKVPTIAATGKAGSVMFFDGRLWHGTGQNLTDEPRIGMLSFYCGPQFRPLENYFLGLDPAVFADASDRLLDLLGYTTWFSYGKADNLSSRKRLRAREAWIPELRIKS
ncbi:ectoine hydroxylase-related dioxygenase (phytanoyl-CoA dioxygenase family) [Bradyrhizobium sp. USDA 4341]